MEYQNHTETEQIKPDLLQELAPFMVDELTQWYLDNDKEFKEDVDKAVSNFMKKDYGKLSKSEIENNNENLYKSTGMILGKYKTCLGYIHIQITRNHDKGYILFQPSQK